jgi:pheromone shutdown protein TraB
MITLIGTAHVLPLRDKIRQAVEDRHPAAVCLELDEQRYQSLTTDRTVSFNPLTLLQRYFASLYGEIPGNDMLGAAEGAKHVGARLFMIDRPIEATMASLAMAAGCELFNPLEIARKMLVLTSKPNRR